MDSTLRGSASDGRGVETDEVMHACTIVARNYLAQAQVLVDSFRKHHPNGTFDVLLVDDPTKDRPCVHGAEVVLVDEIGVDPDVFDAMSAAYFLIELATALKPWMLRSLLDRGYDHAVYFDPDISIERRIGELPGLAREHSIVLTPHLTEPMPRDTSRPSEQDILLSGTYNLGFVAVGATPDGRAMLDWWLERLATDSFIDVANGYFTDQKSMDMVPGLFDHHIVHDPSWNAAYWNLATRPLTRNEAGLRIAGHEPTFFHFSGYSPELPHLVSKHQGPNPRLLISRDPILRQLCDDYGSRLRAAGFSSRQGGFVPPYSVRDGVTMSPLVRRLVREEVRSRRIRATAPEDPVLAIGGVPGLRLPEWLAAPVQSRSIGGLGRLLTEVYTIRPDLQQVFPDVRIGDVTPLLDWAESYGADEMGLPAETIALERARVPPTSQSQYFVRPAQAEGRRKRNRGVEAIGYFTADLGIGESGRQFVRALEQRGVSVSTSTYTRTTSRRGAPWIDRVEPEGVHHDIALLCINADQLSVLMDDLPAEHLKRRYRIGLWFWELDDFPPQMRQSLELLDEVWVTSEFNAVAIRPHTTKPVTVVPLPAHAAPNSGVRIPEIANPDCFTFLFVFDFLSVAERKNPVGLVEAFTRAFPTPGRAQLVIKSINGAKRMADLEKLRYAVADRPDITLIERYLAREELDGLMSGADCYVSLHRSEGFGLTLAETMAIGKPVIATGYSGNLAFMNDENSYLVRNSQVRVPHGCDPYPTTASWADPDLDHAAELMREVLADPEGARRRGEAARAHIAAEFSTDALARIAGARLDEIWAERDARRMRRKARAKASRQAAGPKAVDGVDQNSAELLTAGLKKIRSTTRRGMRAVRRQTR